jgi:hypothetical protein
MINSWEDRLGRRLYIAPAAAPELDRALLDVHHDAVVERPLDSSAESFGRSRSLAAARFLVRRNMEAAAEIVAAVDALRSDVDRVAMAFPTLLDYLVDTDEADADRFRDIGGQARGAA